MLSMTAKGKIFTIQKRKLLFLINVSIVLACLALWKGFFSFSFTVNYYYNWIFQTNSVCGANTSVLWWPWNYIFNLIYSLACGIWRNKRLLFKIWKKESVFECGLLWYLKSGKAKCSWFSNNLFSWVKWILWSC